jgi:hypothetical protein
MEEFRKLPVHIFQSCIFLLAKPEQENAGQEDVSDDFSNRSLLLKR